MNIPTPPVVPPAVKPPWEDQEQNGCLYSLEMLGFVVLILAGVYGLILSIILMSDFQSTLDEGIWYLIISILVLGGSIVGMIFLKKRLKIPAAFLPRKQYSFPSDQLGQPFDVRFKPIQRVSPVGVVQFHEQAIHVEGIRQENTALLFLVGWLFYSLFNKKFSLDLAYNQLSDISCQGKNVTLSFSAGEPNLFTFRTSMQDGERLYRELLYHFPQKMEQYRDVITSLR